MSKLPIEELSAGELSAKVNQALKTPDKEQSEAETIEQDADFGYFEDEE